MTRRQAVVMARKLFGERVALKVGDEISTPERRAQAQEKWHALAAKRDEVTALLEKRKAELLTDPIYQGLLAEKKRLYRDCQLAGGDAAYKRFRVGTVTDLGVFSAFMVKGEGDTWEEAFEDARRER